MSDDNAENLSSLILTNESRAANSSSENSTTAAVIDVEALQLTQGILCLICFETNHFSLLSMPCSLVF